MRIATLNLRNTADRWLARRRLLVRQLVALAPDVIALQELRILPDQGRWIAREVARASGGELRYSRHRRPKSGPAGLWEGIGVLSRVPVVATAWRDLGADHPAHWAARAQGRVVQLVTVRPPEGGLLDVYNTHLGLGGEVLRSAQARRILDWMEGRRPGPAVLLGDLNARPGSPTIELLSGRLRSAHLSVHGCEPPRTAPTPLRRHYTGEGSVLDYVLANELVEVRDARIAFDELEGDLSASDHYGLVVDLSVYCSPASPGPPRR